MSEQMFWKSAYTELIHKVKDRHARDAWAMVKCMRFSIPGYIVELADGKLCSRCFTLDERAHLAQSLRQVAEAGGL